MIRSLSVALFATATTYAAPVGVHVRSDVAAACGEANLHSNLVLTCNRGYVIKSVSHVSFASTTGVCSNEFLRGTRCASGVANIETLCAGKETCSVVSEHVLLDPNNDCPTGRVVSAEATCVPGPNFAVDMYFQKWSESNWDKAHKNMREEKNALARIMESSPSYPTDTFAGRGIVMAAGGKYSHDAMTTVKIIRDFGCKLRIQVWYFGEHEMVEPVKSFYDEQNVETYNILDFTDGIEQIESNIGFRPFQLKPMALLYTDLKEVLVLDADSTPVRDPTYLFADTRYQSTGSVFWPDYWVTPAANPIWELLDGAPSNELEQESGQLLVNKEKAWKAIIVLQALQNQYYYSLLNGDKDTFKFAWKFSETPYEMISFYPAAIGMRRPTTDEFCSHTMGQHDLDGGLLFMHHNQLKLANVVGVFTPTNGFFGEMKSVERSASVHVRAVGTGAITFGSWKIPCLDVETAKAVEPDAVQVGTPGITKTGLETWERTFFDAYTAVAAHMPASFGLALRQHELGLQLVVDKRRRREGECSGVNCTLNAAQCTNECFDSAASTETLAKTSVGDTEIQVVDSAEFAVGDTILISRGTMIEERNTVVGFGPILLKTPLRFKHPAGATVTSLAPEEKIITTTTEVTEEKTTKTERTTTLTKSQGLQDVEITVPVTQTTTKEVAVEVATSQKDAIVDVLSEVLEESVTGYFEVEIITGYEEAQVTEEVGTGVFNLEDVETEQVVGTKTVEVTKVIITGYEKQTKEVLVTSVTIVAKQKEVDDVAQISISLGVAEGKLCSEITLEDDIKTKASVLLMIQESTNLALDQIGAVVITCTDLTVGRKRREEELSEPVLRLSADMIVTASKATVSSGSATDQQEEATTAAVDAMVGIRTAIATDTFDVQTSVGGEASTVVATEVKDAIDDASVYVISEPIEVRIVVEEVTQTVEIVKVQVPTTETVTIVEEQDIVATVTVKQLVEETEEVTKTVNVPVIQTQVRKVENKVVEYVEVKAKETVQVDVIETQQQSVQVQEDTNTTTTTVVQEEVFVEVEVKNEVEVVTTDTTTQEVETVIDCSPVVMENAKGIEKYQLTSVTETAFDDCRSVCEHYAEGKCLFFSYSKTKRRCNMFKKAGSAKPLLEMYVDANDKYATYFRSKNYELCTAEDAPVTTDPPLVEIPACARGFGGRYVLKEKRVGDYTQVVKAKESVADAKACAKLCDESALCGFFSYKATQKRCFLFKGTPDSKDANGIFETYAKETCTESVCEFSRYYAEANAVGADKYLVDKFDEVSSAEECSVMCDAHTDSFGNDVNNKFFFSYKPSNKKCKLFKGAHNGAQKSIEHYLRVSEDYTSYIPRAATCEGWTPPPEDDSDKPKCALQSADNYVKYEKRIGNTKYRVGLTKNVESATTCKDLCGISSTCYFFTYKSASGWCELFKEKGAALAGMEGSKLIFNESADSFIPGVDGCRSTLPDGN